MLNLRASHTWTALLLCAVVPAAFASRVHGQTPRPATPGAPVFKVDPSWPLEMPNNWILGAVTGVFVDARQHVWVTHLPETLTEEETSITQKPPIATCCAAAPPVIEFDAQGKVVQGWGQGAIDDTSGWPRNPHGIFVDHNDFVWVGTYMHHRVMKFTRDGKLVMTIGQYDKNAGSNDTALLGGPAGIWVDAKTNEVYIADGYRNRRVIVFEGATGKYLRHWGAYGEKPDDTEKFDPKTMVNGALPKQFSTVHGLTGSKDGKIYVADRRGNRIQVFDHQGKFLAEKVIAPATLASGSAFVVVLSPDAQEQWLYLADGTNHKIWILRRSDLEVVGEFGHGGRQVGQMLRPHGMSIDAQGNLYVGEASTGRRVQKFAPQKAGAKP
jgi:DNA-binding beta-propeller fold protein YncE